RAAGVRPAQNCAPQRPPRSSENAVAPLPLYWTLLYYNVHCSTMERLGLMTSDSEWLDIAQAAALLRVSEASLRRWTNGGRLPCRRIGGRRGRRFPRAGLMGVLGGGASAAAAGPGLAFYAGDLGGPPQAGNFIGE